MSTIFDTPSNAAYIELKVLPPFSRWCAFDVTLEAAEAGQAKRFAMTLWDSSVLRDETSGDLWYKVPRLAPDKSRDSNRTNLCNSIRVAEARKLPMIGFLKDHINRPNERQQCSIRHLFTIAAVVEDDADDAIWLRLLANNTSDLGCTPTVEQVVKSDWMIDQLAGINRQLQVQADISSHDRAARLKRLDNATKTPGQVVVTTTVYVRNPDVVAEVLHLAKGRCGYCGENAPFFRKSGGTPYLEVHHRIPLSEGGEDTVKNAIAACPNCHRKQHYG
jgi:hypothetical protein